MALIALMWASPVEARMQCLVGPFICWRQSHHYVRHHHGPRHRGIHHYRHERPRAKVVKKTVYHWHVMPVPAPPEEKKWFVW